MSRSSKPTVFIVDDETAVCSALRWLMQSVALPVETYRAAEQFLDAYSPEQPGCLILDVRMPGMSGLKLLEILRARKIQLPVLLLTGHGDVPMAVRAFKMGAVDFLEKPWNNQELLDRVQNMLQRDEQLRSARQAQTERSMRLARLTAREREVLDLLVKALSNKQIAGRLGISEKTVETHRSHIMHKMGARALAQLLSIVLRSQDS
jgi:two-component system response regulator FixJ